MCDPTGAAFLAVSLAMSAASQKMSADAQDAEMDRQYEEAMRAKQLADQASSAKLRADRDALNKKSQLQSEKTVREQMDIQRNTMRDIGSATVNAAANGAAGLSIDNLMTNIYRKEDEAIDVSTINATTAQSNIQSDLQSKETDHYYNLASGTPSHGAYHSDLAIGLNLGSQAAAGGASIYNATNKV